MQFNIGFVFLYDLFKKGLSYYSINVHKSMLSTTFSSSDREDLGKHPFIRLFMKSVFNQKPAKCLNFSFESEATSAVTFVP